MLPDAQTGGGKSRQKAEKLRGYSAPVTAHRPRLFCARNTQRRLSSAGRHFPAQAVRGSTAAHTGSRAGTSSACIRITGSGYQLHQLTEDHARATQAAAHPPPEAHRAEKCGENLRAKSKNLMLRKKVKKVVDKRVKMRYINSAKRNERQKFTRRTENGGRTQ